MDAHSMAHGVVALAQTNKMGCVCFTGLAYVASHRSEVEQAGMHACMEGVCGCRGSACMGRGWR